MNPYERSIKPEHLQSPSCFFVEEDIGSGDITAQLIPMNPKKFTAHYYKAREHTGFMRVKHGEMKSFFLSG